MKCPNCEEILVMSERQGIEIDYCPRCRGVWLDKGELDKIIEKSVSSETDQSISQVKEKKKLYDDDGKRYSDKSRGYENNSKYPKKKDSFLSDLFDF